jgi:hypothetical protein
MMSSSRQVRLISVALIITSIAKVGLLLPMRNAAREFRELSERSEHLTYGVTTLQNFDDSLGANKHFREQILDTVTSVDQLMRVKQNYALNLKKETSEFFERFPDKNAILRKHNILSGASLILSAIWLCLAIPLFIFLLKR